MAKIIFIIIELIILGISVIMIYDARKIATKTFSSNETNETTKVLKIVGFIALVISLLMIYITKIKMWKIKYWYSLLILTDYFEIIIIEIPKGLKAYHKNPNDEVLQWMLFLDNPEKEEVTRIMEENKDIKEAKEELDRISQDDILRRKALNRTLEIADRLQLKKEAEEALKKGKKEKTNEIVKRMKDADLSIEQIAQIVELKVDEVKAILNEKN